MKITIICLLFLLSSCGSYHIEGGGAFNIGNYEQRAKDSTTGTGFYVKAGWYRYREEGIGISLNYQPNIGYFSFPTASTIGFGTAELKYRKLIGVENKPKIGLGFGLGGGLTLSEGGTSSFDIGSGSGELSLHTKNGKIYGILRSKHYLNLGNLKPENNGAYNHAFQVGAGFNF